MIQRIQSIHQYYSFNNADLMYSFNHSIYILYVFVSEKFNFIRIKIYQNDHVDS